MRQATRSDLGHGRDQAPRVGVLRLIQESRGGAELHELAGVEHAYAICELRHRPEIVRDEQDRRLNLSMQRAHELQDMRLHDDVERRGWLVHQEHVRTAGKRHGDHHPLSHAPAELVGIGSVDAPGVVELDKMQQLVRTDAGAFAIHAEVLT